MKATRSNRWSRAVVGWLIGIFFTCQFTAPCSAQNPLDRRVDEAISRGTDFLLAQQAPDGSFSNGRFVEAVTAWSVLALAAAGHSAQDRSREGEVMRAGIDFVLRSGVPLAGGTYFGGPTSLHVHNAPDGYIGHGMVTVAMTQLLLLGADKTRERELRQQAHRAVELIVATQQKGGAWQASPYHSQPGCIYHVTWQLLALQSAKEAGIAVPEKTVYHAGGYIRECYWPGGPMPLTVKVPRSAMDEEKTRFQANIGFTFNNLRKMIIPRDTASDSWLMCGVRALHAAGLHGTTESLSATSLVISHPPLRVNYEDFYRTAFLYAQIVARNPDGTVEQLLMPLQRKDGSWLAGIAPNPRVHDRVQLKMPETPPRISVAAIQMGVAHPPGNGKHEYIPPLGYEFGEVDVGSAYCTSMAVIGLAARSLRLPMSRY
jgi:hypothetical protein